MLRIALFVLVGVVLAAGDASAQRRLEWNCPAMVASISASKVWWGRFSGGKETMFTFGRDAIVPKTTEACFRTRQECERWLYDLKSEYQYDPRWNQCRLGYAPGAPIPRL